MGYDLLAAHYHLAIMGGHLLAADQPFMVQTIVDCPFFKEALMAVFHPAVYPFSAVACLTVLASARQIDDGKVAGAARVFANG
jgi:hypothetical protein